MAGVDVLSQLFRDHNRMLVAYLTNHLRDMTNDHIREIGLGVGISGTPRSFLSTYVIHGKESG